MKKKILFVFGTRPEAIKMAPVIRLFKQDSRFFISRVCVTAQHREMLDQVLEIFEIKPDWDLQIMKQDQDLFDISASVLLKMKNVLSEFRPDIVLVHGDTNTTMASALAAFYMKIPVGHIEAGLRTHNIYSPWPEEMNRQIVSRISTFHFVPTENSRNNLLNEGIPSDKIVFTGNTIIDALNFAQKIIKIRNPEITGFPEKEIKKKDKIILITGHRRENFGDGFKSICRAINRLADKFPEVNFVYPVHLNPNIQKQAKKYLNINRKKNIHLIKPLDYLSFITLMKRAFIILTDSGGIQEEAPSLGKPVLLMRELTERPEGLASGIVKMVGVDEKLIVDEVTELLCNYSAYRKRAVKANPYGDGKASLRILNFIKNYFQVKV
ncbi:MAG: UDP-N-acetylglucosamine 2-epimerase (non-hydrolyzing) [Bacteroidales bacterium]|nr:UDP-N-acetylglucosamine 2-epimerase (non-hydrolyzing) [Bacteroidales bacterium]